MRWWCASWLLLAACGAEDPALDLTELEAMGPHQVGFTSMDVVYDAPLQAAPRTIHTFVWYPAEAAEGERPIYTLKTSDVAVTDAPPKALGALPVVVFSHGSQAYAAAMSHWMEHLASHGFLVIAPTHTGNTFTDGADRDTDIYYLRAHDVAASLDFIKALPSTHPLAGLVGDKIALSGHSFGAYTGFAMAGATYPVDALDAGCTAGTVSTGYCSTLDDAKRDLFRAGFEDDRFRALISIDPGDFELFTAAGVAEVDVPVLHMVAEKSGHRVGDPSTDGYWQALSDPNDLRLLLEGGDHNDFVDACGEGFDLRCSTLRPGRVHPPVHIYALAFLRRVLLGEDGYDALLSGTPLVSDLFEITQH